MIGFDVLNEPNWGSYPIFAFEKDKLAPLYDQVVVAVRAVAPRWVAFLEPAASRNGGIATSLPIAPYPDVMYAPHSYDTTAESGGGFDPSHRQMILDNVADLAREAGDLHAGLWIGEYGGVAANPGIVDYMTDQYDAAGAVAGSTMYWSYDKSDGYSLLDADGNEKPDLVEYRRAAVSRARCRHTGELRVRCGHVHVGDEGRSGRYRADADQHARSRVSERLPSRVRRLCRDQANRRALDHGLAGDVTVTLHP